MRTLEELDVKLCVNRLPRDVRTLLWESTGGQPLILAGGFIRSCIVGEPVHDIDLFPPSKGEAIRMAKLLHTVAWGGRQYAVPVRETGNALTVVLPSDVAVQFVYRWVYNSAAKLLSSFDYTISQAAIWSNIPGDWKSCCVDTYYSDLAARRLVYTLPTRFEAPGGSMLRLLKFTARGYRANFGSIGALVERLSSPRVLQTPADELVDFGSETPVQCEARERRTSAIIRRLFQVDPNAPGLNSNLNAPEVGFTDESEKSQLEFERLISEASKAPEKPEA